MKLLRCLAQSSIVLLDEEPGNFIFSEVGAGWIDGSGGHSHGGRAAGLVLVGVEEGPFVAMVATPTRVLSVVRSENVGDLSCEFQGMNRNMKDPIK